MTDGARCTSRIYVDFESWLISFMNCSLWSGLLFRASYWKWNLSQLNNRNWNKKADIPPFTWMHSFWTFFCNLLHIYSGVDLNLLDCHVIVQVHKFIIFISISRDGDFFLVVYRRPLRMFNKIIRMVYGIDRQKRYGFLWFGKLNHF